MYVMLSNILRMYDPEQFWAPSGFGDLGRNASYFQGAGEHW